MESIFYRSRFPLGKSTHIFWEEGKFAFTHWKTPFCITFPHQPEKRHAVLFRIGVDSRIGRQNIWPARAVCLALYFHLVLHHLLHRIPPLVCFHQYAFLPLSLTSIGIPVIIRTHSYRIVPIFEGNFSLSFQYFHVFSFCRIDQFQWYFKYQC